MPTPTAGTGNGKTVAPPLPRGFWSLWMAVVVDLIGFGIVLPILPLYVSDFGATTLTVGVVLSAYSVAQLVGSPLLGRLSDRYGRRPVLVIALFGSAVGHLVTGLAGSVGVVVLARLFDGFSGGSLSIAHAAAADLTPPPQRPRVFGLLGAGIALGFVAGPAIGSLAARSGPALPFMVAAGLCGANALTAWWRLGGLASPQHAQTPAGAGHGGHSARGPAARSMLGALTPATLLGRTLLTSLVLAVGFSGFESTFSLLGKVRVGLTVATAGLVFAAVGVVLSVVQAVLVKRVIAARGPVRTARLAVAANLCGFVLLVPSSGWWGLAPALGLLTVGQGLLNPSMSTMISSFAPADKRGEVFGMQQAVSAAGRILGPLVALGLFGLAVPLPYATGAVLALGGLAALTTFPVPRPSAEGHVAAAAS